MLGLFRLTFHQFLDNLLILCSKQVTLISNFSNFIVRLDSRLFLAHFIVIHDLGWCHRISLESCVGLIRIGLHLLLLPVDLLELIPHTNALFLIALIFDQKLVALRHLDTSLNMLDLCISLLNLSSLLPDGTLVVVD